MAFHNGRQFSAKDKDVDAWSRSCAQRCKSGWWYRSCYDANLNGLYLKGKYMSANYGVNWYHWERNHYSLKGTTMMVRRE